LSDRIFIEGIKFHGFHGLTRMEREVGVRLSVDVTLVMDLEPSGKNDDFALTIDYRQVHKRVVEIGRNTSHKLLETYAVALLDALHSEFSVRRITVKVRKETPVLDGIVDSVGVILSRDGKEQPER
jgi:dihydroneopterin aldolase